MNLFLRHMTVGIALGISSFGTTVFSAENSTPNLKSNNATAKNIIMQMADAYKDCKSYLDSGVVKTTFSMKKRIWVTKRPFITAFVRPNLFRFEFSSKFSPKAKSNLYIIYAKDKDVRTWWDIKPGIEKKVSLSMAIAGATGVSGSSAHTVPVLLMPKIGGRSLADFKASRISDFLLNGTMCYRLKGTICYRDNKSKEVAQGITLWISKKTFLIHQINRSNKFPNFRTETTTTYKAKVNIDIPKNNLEFNAPVKGSK